MSYSITNSIPAKLIYCAHSCRSWAIKLIIFDDSVRMGRGGTHSILFGSRNKVSAFCKVAILSLHVQLSRSFPSKGSACMLELNFAHDYQAAIYDRFVLTIFKAGTEESTSEQVSLSICISLQRLFCRSTGSSLFVQWVFGVLTQNTSTNPWDEVQFLGGHISQENRTVSNIFISQNPNQKKIRKTKITFIHSWPRLDVDQQYQGRSTSLKGSLFPLPLVHSWLKTRRKQPTVCLGSSAKKRPSQWKHFLLMP